MEITEEMRAVVERLVSDRFPNAKILRIELQSDFDYEDEEILKVRVVFEAEDERLDAGATSSFLRHLRPKLSAIGVNSFPVMSFVSGRDANGVAA